MEFTHVPAELMPLWQEVRAINEALGDRASCYYCGEIAECEDHVIPHSLLHNRDTPRGGYGTDTLPACNDCNVRLGSTVLDTISERCKHLTSRLELRFRKWLTSEAWVEEEIDQLGFALAEQARAFNHTKRSATLRIAHLEARAARVSPMLLRPYRGAAWDSVEIVTCPLELIRLWVSSPVRLTKPTAKRLRKKRVYKQRKPYRKRIAIKAKDSKTTTEWTQDTNGQWECELVANR